jgi:hypothetical protein
LRRRKGLSVLTSFFFLFFEHRLLWWTCPALGARGQTYIGQDAGGLDGRAAERPVFRRLFTEITDARATDWPCRAFPGIERPAPYQEWTQTNVRGSKMNIQGVNAFALASYAAHKPAIGERPVASPSSFARPGGSTEVSISSQGMALSAASETQEVDARLAEIKAKPALERSSEETDYVNHYDTRKAELSQKDAKTWSADDVDYMQKAGGFVNTMSQLSPGEKKLYDEMVAKGDTQAAEGMAQVAMSRMGGGEVTLKDGRTFDPRETEITPKNVRERFTQTIVDPSGRTGRAFEALASYLDGRKAADSA